jgi:hypothetical protein
VSVPNAHIRQTILTQWVEAFNARDLDAMLTSLSLGVEFRPLKLEGLRECYHGHTGVREWFTQFLSLRAAHHIVLSDVRDLGEGKVFAVGALRVAADEPEIGPFCALHRLNGRLIIAARHFLTDPDMVEHIAA